MTLAATIRAHLKLRDRLAAEFPMPESQRAVLLDLALARIEGRRVDMTGACIATGLKGGGPIQAVHRLEAMGLVGRTSDRSDARRCWLHITDEGFARIEEALSPAIARAA